MNFPLLRFWNTLFLFVIWYNELTSEKKKNDLVVVLFQTREVDENSHCFVCFVLIRIGFVRASLHIVADDPVEISRDDSPRRSHIPHERDDRGE